MRDGVGRKVKWGQGKRKSDKMGVDLLVLYFGDGIGVWVCEGWVFVMLERWGARRGVIVFGRDEKRGSVGAWD